MKEIKLKPENLQKAWDKGCSDVKEILEMLHPDFEFEEKVEGDECKIHAFASSAGVFIANKIKEGKWSLVNMSSPSLICYKMETLNKIISSCKRDEYGVFDNQKEFFEWALKQINDE